MELTSEFGTEGTWALEGMNECWRLCKYTSGGLFAPHSDGMFARFPSFISFLFVLFSFLSLFFFLSSTHNLTKSFRSRSERSMYTFMIYLNGSLDFAVCFVYFVSFLSLFFFFSSSFFSSFVLFFFLFVYLFVREERPIS